MYQRENCWRFYGHFFEIMDPITSSAEKLDPEMDMVIHFCSLRNILSDKISFDPSDEAIKATKFPLRKSSCFQNISECKNGKAVSKEDERANKTQEETSNNMNWYNYQQVTKEFAKPSEYQEVPEDMTWYNDEMVEDTICLGATFIITITLLCVLVYCYFYKDYN